MKGRDTEPITAEVFGWRADAGAVESPDDHRRRVSFMIERALELTLNRPDEFLAFGGPMLAAAWGTLHARNAAYPDMVSAIAYVLATRGTGPHHDAATEVQWATAAAAVLALTDPATARQILRDIESRSNLDPANLARLAGDRWLMAWALADTEHAQTLIDAEMAAPAGQSDVDLRPTGILKMAEVLASVPARREEFLRAEIGTAWRPAP
jgi:hypothetical protein